MEQSGTIVCHVERGESAPDRKIFSVTDLGRQLLSAWMTESAEPEVGRLDVMVKVRAAAFDDPRRLLAPLRERRAQHAQLLAAWQDVEQRDFVGERDVQRALQHQVLQFGLAYQQLWIDWLAETEQLIDQFPATLST